LSKHFVYVAALIVGFGLSSMARGQNAQSGQQFVVPSAKAAVEKEHCGQSGQPGTLYEKLCLETKTSAPAPKRDISGAWAGPIQAVQPVDPIPPMTPWGQMRYAGNKGNFSGDVADSNDPINHCDPLGFPRNAVFELRGLAIGGMPNRVLILSQYERAWREIWTDGRALPKGAGTDDLNAPDPRYYGYSVGHWDGDYTLVVDTVGTDDASWIDNFGHPHSDQLHAVERYTRLDHDTLQVTVTIDDPTTYTKTFMLGKTIYKWIPSQDFEEQLCIPSAMEAYQNAIAKPAGAKK
jgi:hypothetical protein